MESSQFVYVSTYWGRENVVDHQEIHVVAIEEDAADSIPAINLHCSSFRETQVGHVEYPS
jgi:hypothetical protein